MMPFARSLGYSEQLAPFRRGRDRRNGLRDNIALNFATSAKIGAFNDVYPTAALENGKLARR
jgi:hypothetical protein